MAYKYDNDEISDLARDWAASERSEHRAAARASVGDCGMGRHRMVPDGRGGGVCACGETVSRDDL